MSKTCCENDGDVEDIRKLFQDHSKLQGSLIC